jgi:hypothetical protein
MAGSDSPINAAVFLALWRAYTVQYTAAIIAGDWDHEQALAQTLDLWFCERTRRFATAANTRSQQANR